MKEIEELFRLAGYALIALAWISWRLRLVTVPALIVVIAFNLAGCKEIRDLSRGEGAGFSNNGRAVPLPAFYRKRATSNAGAIAQRAGADGRRYDHQPGDWLRHRLLLARLRPAQPLAVTKDRP